MLETFCGLKKLWRCFLRAQRLTNSWKLSNIRAMQHMISSKCSTARHGKYIQPDPVRHLFGGQGGVTEKL
jgi:hypothetical protein